jgi:lipopolysaccharide core galacturonosyltransferase RgtB
VKRWFETLKAVTSNRTEGGDRALTVKLFAGLAVYFAVHILIRVATKDSLTSDEAEQVFLTNDFALGYFRDPPLYSWLQFLIFQVLGTSVLSLSILKNGLLFLTYIFFFLSARLLFENTRVAVLATLSLLLIPEIAWESQRDRTHTVLAATLSSATLYVMLCLIRERATRRYLLLGILLGLGALSKYNYMCFVLAAFTVMLVNRKSRPALLDGRIVLSAGLGLLIVMPHLIWWATHRPELLHPSYTDRPDPYHVEGLLELAESTAAFLTPVALVYLVLFPKGYLPRERARGGNAELFDSAAYLTALAVILIASVVLLNLTSVKVRWLQPILFVFPLYFLGYLGNKEVSQRQWRSFLGVIAVIVVLIPLVSIFYNTGLVVWRFGLIHYSFHGLAEELRRRGLEKAVVVTDNIQMAGNLHYEFPRSVVVIPNINERELAQAVPGQTLVVVWGPAKLREMPQDLSNFLQDAIVPDVRALPVEYKVPSHGGSSDRSATVGLVIMPLSASAAGQLAKRSGSPARPCGVKDSWGEV